MPQPALAIQNLSKSFGQSPAVLSASLSAQAGQTIALLGPSGCGKSTVLRMIAGLLPPDSGHIFLSGRDATQLPPEQRNIGMVFQDYALFPHFNVLENVSYGASKRLGRSAAQAAAQEALALVSLSGLEKRRIHQLSGGQQQRVALARALATRSPLLLLDEPLSNLDEKLRRSLRHQLKNLLQHSQATTLLVTHDQREALAIADHIAIMRSGKIIQFAPAAEVFAKPASAWVAAFLGHLNIYSRGSEALLIPESAIRLGAGSSYPVSSRSISDSGEEIEILHPLGKLHLQLSPREAQLLEVSPSDHLSLRLSIDHSQTLTLPDDRDPNEAAPPSHISHTATR